jgi:hypothetical protein
LEIDPEGNQGHEWTVQPVKIKIERERERERKTERFHCQISLTLDLEEFEDLIS